MANQFLFVNFFATELISAVQVSDTVLQIPPDAALSMPPFTSGFDVPLTLWDGQNPPEIVWCIANPQTGALTVLRAQEGTSAFAWAAGTQVISSLTAAVINAALLAYNTGLVLIANYLPLSGGTLTGPLTLSGAPTLPLHAADKAYVDGLGAGFMPISGGTFSGNVSMNGNRLLALPVPATGAEPATKSYADAITASVTSYAQDVSGIYVTTGTGAAYALSPGKYGGGLTDGLKLGFRLHATSRNAPTLAVDGTAAVPLRTQSGVNETSATWPVGMVMSAEYRASGPEWLVFGNSMPLGTVPTTGGTLAYFISTGLGLTLLEDGIILQAQINVTNTGTMTLNVDGLGAVPLRPYTGVDFKSGQVKQYAALLIRYNNATGEWLVIDQAAPRLDQCIDVTLAGLTAGQSLGWNGATWTNQRNSPRGYIDGCVLSNDTGTPNTVVDIAAGLCRADDDTVDIQLAAFTKQLNAIWAIGSGVGGLDTGAIAANSTYAVFAIYNPSTLVSDILLSKSTAGSFASPIMPSGFTKKRYIGSILTNNSSNILPFKQLGDDFLLVTGLARSQGVASAAAMISVGDGTTPAVPAGIQVIAHFWANCAPLSPGSGDIRLYCPDQADTAVVNSFMNMRSANLGGSGNASQGGDFLVRTNTSQQIRGISTTGGGGMTVFFGFNGWIDQRGKNA